MIKKGHFGDQIQDHNRGELWDHPEAFSAGFAAKNGELDAFYIEFENR
jgi:hypothetical protein